MVDKGSVVEDADAMTLGEALRAERKRRGWSTAQLGRDVLGVSQQRASQVERGIGRPERSTLPKITKFLHLKAAEVEQLWEAAGAASVEIRETLPSFGERVVVAHVSVEDRVTRLEAQMDVVRELLGVFAGRLGVEVPEAAVQKAE